MIKIAIVDDKLVNRQTIKKKLDSISELKVVLEAVNGQDFFEKIKDMPEAQYPGVVLMDIDMPVMNGIETIAIGTVKYPTIRFLVLSIFDDDDKIFAAIQAGASGYLLKEDVATDLEEAINEAYHLNGAPMSPAIARKTLQWLKQIPKPTHPSANTESDILSQREIEILKLLVEGLDYKKIATKLFISPYTVRSHTSKIYQKLQVHSKAQVIQIAHKYKWI